MNYGRISFAGLLLIASTCMISGCSTRVSAEAPNKDKDGTAVRSNVRGANGQTVQFMQPAEVAATLNNAKEVKDVAGGGDFIVSGNKLFNFWFVKADRIIFESGATLTFSRQAQTKRNQFFIVAKELISKDPNAPGTITWEKGPVQSSGASSGQAPSGPEGGVGAAGSNGSQGYAGDSAPTLTMIVMNVLSSAPLVDLTGQQGGQGGQGQKGGTGGHGHTGESASQNAFNCVHGAGNGGAGGAGGQGGPGGVGGSGGSGGTFVLISRVDRLPSLTQKFRALIAGGKGGDSGSGGIGGDPGSGGDGGAQQLPWCRGDGSPGPTGPVGQSGALGKTGDTGKEGDFTVGGVTDQQFAEYVWSR